MDNRSNQEASSVLSVCWWKGIFQNHKLAGCCCREGHTGRCGGLWRGVKEGQISGSAEALSRSANSDIKENVAQQADCFISDLPGHRPLPGRTGQGDRPGFGIDPDGGGDRHLGAGSGRQRSQGRPDSGEAPKLVDGERVFVLVEGDVLVVRVLQKQLHGEMHGLLGSVDGGGLLGSDPRCGVAS